MCENFPSLNLNSLARHWFWRYAFSFVVLTLRSPIAILIADFSCILGDFRILHPIATTPLLTNGWFLDWLFPGLDQEIEMKASTDAVSKKLCSAAEWRIESTHENTWTHTEAGSSCMTTVGSWASGYCLGFFYGGRKEKRKERKEGGLVTKGHNMGTSLLQLTRLNYITFTTHTLSHNAPDSNHKHTPVYIGVRWSIAGPTRHFSG